MTQDEMRPALQVGPEWSPVWCGADLLFDGEQWCGGFDCLGGRYGSETRAIPYAPTAMPGIEVARSERCRMVWVRITLQ